MGLSAFQDAWLDLMLHPQHRKAWRAGELNYSELSSDETQSLHEISEAVLAPVSGAVIEGKTQIFLSALPSTIKPCLPEKTWRYLAREYATRYEQAHLYPLEETLPHWLGFISHYLTEQGNAPPHLQDLLRYEACSIGLVFYHLPRPLEAGKSGLSPATGLITAGPHLRTVLGRLYQNQNIQDLPDSPKQGYLLQRTYRGIQLEALHWSIYELLSRVEKNRTWTEALQDLLQQYPELKAQEKELYNWQKHFQQRKIIF